MSIDKQLFISGVTEKYDKRLLENRISTEGNVIACLVKDITLIDDTKLEAKQFLTKDGRFYFGLINSLRKKNFNTIDEVTILSNSTEKVLKEFDDRGGFDTLSNMAEIVNLNNFDTYLNLLYRENLLCSLYDDGFNLFKDIDVNGKKIETIKLFRKMTSNQIIDYLDSKLSSYDTGQSSEVVEEEDIYFDDEWVNELEEANDMGVPYDVCGINVDGEEIKGFRLMSNQTLGLHRGHLMMIAGFSSVGKSTIFVTILMALLYRGEKIIVISNEERVQKIKSKIMMWILARHNKYFKLTRSKLSAGNLTEEDKKEIKKAQKWWNDNYRGCLRYVTINTNDISLIKKKIRDAHLRYGFTGFLLDTFKLNDDSFSGERQDLSLVRDSRELHNLAMKYDLIGMCSCQCGERFKGTRVLTANVLSSSKQTKEVLQQLFMCRSVYPEELNPKSKLYIHPFRRRKVGDKWIEDQIEIDPDAVYILLFIEKNRDGIDTPSDNVSYLLRFDGAHSTFIEAAQVRVQHGFIQ